MTSTPRRPRASAVLPALLTASTLLLAACGGTGDGGATTTTTTASSAPDATASSGAPASSSAPTSSSSAPTGTGGVGCPATTEQVPAGAATAVTADLDHDGAADELWLADTGGQRLLGVRTASGAVFSTAYESASPIGTTAIGQRLDDTTSVVLLSDGRQVPLYAVTTDGASGCALVASENEQGDQYTFDLGFTGYGSGVACVPPDGSGDDLALYGLLVVGGDVEGDLPLVERTRIDLSDGGRQARNGPTDRPAELAGINPEGPQVAAAREVRCGDQGSDTAVSEPS